MSGTASRCAACKYLRRRCPQDCIFSPHFPSSDPQRFASVHRIYGASNVGKMLQQLPESVRSQAVNSLHYEAQCRIQDPVYGCVGIISGLQRQIRDIESEIARTRAAMTVSVNPNVDISELNIQHLQNDENLSDQQKGTGQSMHGII